MFYYTVKSRHDSEGSVHVLKKWQIKYEGKMFGRKLFT